MNIRKTGHAYTIIPVCGKKYRVAMILSEHDTFEEAMEALMDAMKKESDEIRKIEYGELKKRGIKVRTLEEVIKDMSPEELEAFKKERYEKFVKPLLDENISALERLKSRFNLKRIK